MADFELLAPGGHQKLVEEVEDRLDLKADIDGYYAQLTAGAADNLTGRGDATTAEFLYRTAGGTADIETGQAVAKSIKGNTLVWNQLYHKNVESATVRGITYTIDANGLITLNGTVSQTGYILGYVVPVTVGHKYLACGHGGNFDGSKVTFRLQVSGGIDSTNSGLILTVAAGTTQFAPAICLQNLGDTLTNVTFRPQLFDLTQMFGAGNEPSTVAEFEALFPLPYYEYDAGSLLSVNMEGIETVGFNQWDEEWEVGSYSNVTGEKTADAGVIRCKNLIPVFPSTDYQLSGYTTNLFFYDANGAFISAGSQIANNTFTTPANCHYVTFRMDSAYGTTYKGDICLHLVWSGRRNGEYEAFWKSQRLIDVATYFPDGMRSAGSVRDELTSTEAITRVGAVDLGTLTWAKNDDWGKNGPAFYTANNVVVPESNGNVAANVICSILPTVSWASLNGNSLNGLCVNASGSIIIRLSSHASDTASAFKTAMSGVYLFYALATPTVTPIDPSINMSYRVDDFGTERIMVPEDERSAPPVLDIAYGLNVVDFVRRAPTEYISHDSFTQFRIALATFLDATITESWDATDGRYEYTITQNGE